MAGNGVLLKHSENCTGSGQMLRDIHERVGLPKGLFEVLLISHDQSDAIIAPFAPQAHSISPKVRTAEHYPARKFPWNLYIVVENLHRSSMRIAVCKILASDQKFSVYHRRD